MVRFIASRMLQAVPTLLALVTITFFLLRLVPGGPFATEKAVSAEAQRALEAHYGLDRPLSAQFGSYLWGITPKRFRPDQLFTRDAASGQTALDLEAAFGMDFGLSFAPGNRAVSAIIAEKLPVSLELGGLAMLVALALGIPAGALAALRPNTALDYVPSAFAMVGICVPTFVIGPLLVLVFGVELRWFNASGWEYASDRVLPALTLGVVFAAYIARLTRAGMRDVLTQDFVRTARAKGASESRIVWRHALRGGLLPVVSYLGPTLAGILTGSFVIETIFHVPGLGYEFVSSALNRDYTLVTGLVILYALLIIAFNLAVDIAVVGLNPRLRSA